ncbi:hypothetical protein PTKIN_Ptkin03bG0170900 [Pterospermum kingtungense]
MLKFVILDLDYLEISLSEFNDVQSIEGYIGKWGKHLEFAVKHLFEAEFKPCNDVFERMGQDVWMGCFAKIAAQADILAFFQFGKTVTESKKDPIKLLNLFDIFASLNNLRLDFNRLFGGADCIEIQNQTRDLIKRVIDGAAEIFCELFVQVELQRQSSPPQDGNVPKLVKAYDNATLSCLFAMNNHWHLNPETYQAMGKIEAKCGQATARDLVKKRLKTFNEAFDEMYRKQFGWVISEKDLREKTCQLIVQIMLPVY